MKSNSNCLEYTPDASRVSFDGNRELPFDYEPETYLDRRGSGFFTHCVKNPSWRQSSYPTEQLATVVRAADPSLDNYITQATFTAPNRLRINVESVGLLFSDLDTYRVERLASLTPEAQAEKLLSFCDERRIPRPSIILSSGHGLHAKWLLSQALGGPSLPEWNEAQTALVRVLEPFAADRAAKDISRVLRLDRTTNTKTGELCRVLFSASGDESVLARYEFEELAVRLASLDLEHGEEREQRESEPEKPRLVRQAGRLTRTRLNWYRFYDLRDLWKLRGGVPVGYRELTLFWMLNFLLLAEPGRVGTLWREAESLAKEIDGADRWWQRGDLSTVYRKALAMRDGQKVQFGGRELPPLYTPRNQTLITTFSITPDEERHLRTIVSTGEKVRRQREKRRAAGAKPRKRYEAESIEGSKPWESQGISRATWYRRLASEA